MRNELREYEAISYPVPFCLALKGVLYAPGLFYVIWRSDTRFGELECHESIGRNMLGGTYRTERDLHVVSQQQ